MQMPGRKYAQANAKYRYGFNGKENDNDVKGDGNQQDYGMRIYDPRLGRFLSVDPLTKKYPWYTPYQFSGNNPIKFIDLDGLEPANNPKDPANQNGRNPTKTIDQIYSESGGDKNFDNNLKKYLNGTNDKDATVSGVSNKPGYASDSKGGADKGNLWVNNKGVLKVDDYRDFDTRGFANFLLGSMIKGVGAENIEFPVNGTASNFMKGAGITKDAINAWYDLNKGKTTLSENKAEFSGNSHMLGAFVNKGMFNPESFIGSATVTIKPINDKEVLVQIFNVTSITSGDPYKIFPWNSVPISVVRDPAKAGTGANRYGNISQLYQFTLPIETDKLKK